MNFRYSPGHSTASCMLALVLVTGIWGWIGVPPVSAEDPVPPTAEAETLVAASLHNPGFDNQDWYEFNKRYQGSYPVSMWLPDDDNNVSNQIPADQRQDWVMWFLDGRAIVDSEAEKSVIYGGYEGIWMRPDSEKSFLGGLYQVIRNVTPCLVYNFKMYGRSQPTESGDVLYALQVGIDRNGWHPDSARDPAVHGSFPNTTVWGTSQKYTNGYGLLEVTAEPINTTMTVFTYGDAGGGRSHRVFWDAGSLEDVTPAAFIDPKNPTGLLLIDPVSNPGQTSASISWTTNHVGAGISQVYYRLIDLPTYPPVSTTPPYSNVLYMPLVYRDNPALWESTSVNKALTTSHYFILNGLVRGATYEYVVVTRGVSSGQCTNWISLRKTFTLQP